MLVEKLEVVAGLAGSHAATMGASAWRLALSVTCEVGSGAELAFPTCRSPSAVVTFPAAS